jgi:RNA polymerase sigma factor (TIGR02999 family)
MDDITRLLAEAKGADGEAKNRLWQALYGELHRLARSQLRRNGGGSGSLDTTALLHEAYIKMVRVDELQADSRGQFFSYASKVMRSIVIDICRERMSERRGGGIADITLNTSISDSVARSDEDLVRISDALEELGKVNPRLVQVVEMRFFGGLTEEEIAESLGVTTRTIQRDWDKARMLMLAAVS